MKIFDILKFINGKLITYENQYLAKDYTKAFACDLMSDCLTFIDDSNCLLITGLTNAQALRTAEMIDIDCIIFARGKKPNQEMVELAKNHQIMLISTDFTVYEVSGILYQAGILGLKL